MLERPAVHDAASVTSAMSRILQAHGSTVSSCRGSARNPTAARRASRSAPPVSSACDSSSSSHRIAITRPMPGWIPITRKIGPATSSSRNPIFTTISARAMTMMRMPADQRGEQAAERDRQPVFPVLALEDRIHPRVLFLDVLRDVLVGVGLLPRSARFVGPVRLRQVDRLRPQQLVGVLLDDRRVRGRSCAELPLQPRLADQRHPQPVRVRVSRPGSPTPPDRPCRRAWECTPRPRYCSSAAPR